MTKALILIDLQKGLCLPGGAGAQGLAERVKETRTLETAERLLVDSRAQRMNIFHIRLSFEAGYSNRTNRSARFNEHEAIGRFVSGTVDTEFCDEVAPAPGETVLAKGSVGAFASTALESSLRAAGVTEIVLAGVATHFAIESTVREAVDRTFNVTVIKNACTGPKALHDNSIENILPLFANVRTY